MLLALSAALLPPAARAELSEVHEWGTFTVSSGSDGQPLAWYSTAGSITELPDFVLRNTGPGKALASPYAVRMETPVLYFYATAPTPVTVEATYAAGTITEYFPHAARLGTSVTWTGELAAPTDPQAAAALPSLAGKRGTHYGHARDVPDAWFFHATARCEPTGYPGYVAASPWEKYLFYRGAGDALPPLRASVDTGGTVTLLDFGTESSGGEAFALEVDGDQARWQAIAPHESGKPEIRTSRLDAPFRPLAGVEAELGAALEKTLVAAGLTVAEAKAMIATWRDVWFREHGLRVFALLPRTWVDTTVPLTIAPAPKKLTRVFVGRFELFTPTREQALSTLLKGVERAPDDATRAAFSALRLGRFDGAALKRAQDLETARMTRRMAELQRPRQRRGIPRGSGATAGRAGSYRCSRSRPGGNRCGFAAGTTAPWADGRRRDRPCRRRRSRG